MPTSHRLPLSRPTHPPINQSTMILTIQTFLSLFLNYSNVLGRKKGRRKTLSIHSFSNQAGSFYGKTLSKKEKMAKLEGHYKLERNENMDEYFSKVGKWHIECLVTLFKVVLLKTYYLLNAKWINSWNRINTNIFQFIWK